MESSWMWKFAAACAGLYFALDFLTVHSVAVYVTYIAVIGGCVFGVWNLFQPGAGSTHQAHLQMESVPMDSPESPRQ